MQALHHYQAQSQEELAAVAGETITVLQQNADGWWKCRNSRGQEGYLPMNFLGSAPAVSSSSKHGSSGSSSGDSGPDTKRRSDVTADENPLGINPSRSKIGVDSTGMGVIDLVISFSEIILGQELGKGGFGIVYRGERHGDNVAVKRLLCQTMDETTKRAFLEEASMMLRLQHGNIVRLYGVSLEPYAMVMEFMEGGSLDKLLYGKAPLGYVLRYKMALDIANGLSFLHSKDMVHCDLKSLNVLLDDRYKAKLADFGMSKIKTKTATQSYYSGARAGTLLWSAPEVLDDERNYTKAADVYSYGIILLEILSRRIPFSFLSGQRALISFVLQGKREPIPENSPQILARLTQECWAQEPEQRPTMVQVVRELKESPVTEESVMPQQTYTQTSSASSTAAYGVDSIASGRGRGLPQTPGPRLSGYEVASHNSSGFFQPAQSTGSHAGAYGVDSTMPGRGRGLPAPPGTSSSSSFFPAIQPALGGGYGVDSTKPYGSGGRGLPQTPNANISGPSSGYSRGGYG
jgi:serine/threonine protein kinase